MLRSFIALFFLSSAIFSVAQYDVPTVTLALKTLKSPCSQDFEGSPPTLVYVWSPRMVLSAQQADVAQRAAAAAGLVFKPVHDAQLGNPELAAALQRLRQTQPNAADALQTSSALCNAYLLQNQAQRHFPTAFVWSGAAFAPHPIVGAMPAVYWAQSIAQRLQAAPSAGDPQACIAPWQFVPLEANAVGTQTDAYGKTSVALGSYERISPDGRFVLRSFSGGRLGDVSLIELSADGKVAKTYETPLSNEAFPVQGTWRYLVDVNGEHYSFKSILLSQKSAKPLFKAGMTGFYAAAAELPTMPNDPTDRIRIRSMSWPNPSGNVDTQGEGALVARTVEVDTALHKVTFDSGFQHLCTQRVAQDGPLYALPMLSVDGQEFAALPQTPVQGQPTMRIFGFGPDGKGCEPRTAFAFASGKTIFGFPPEKPLSASNLPTIAAVSPHTGADLAYEINGQVWWFNRFLNQAFNLAPYLEPSRLPNPASDAPSKQSLIASAFPGITRDGRVMYAANWQTCPAPTPSAPTPVCTERPGYIIADPYQSNAYQSFLRQYKGAARRQCITQGDVQAQRAAFSSLHGLENRH